MNDSNSSVVGISFTGVLFLIFLVLRLTGAIAWSWWWVTAPLWMPITLLIIGVIVASIVIIIKAKRYGRK
jgi:hypothetical protein